MSKEFFIKKTLRLAFSLLLFSLALYGLLYLSTGDPALGFLRRMGVEAASEETLAATRKSLGLDGNFFQQYGHWLKNMLKGDFGQSFMSKQPVLDLIQAKISVTVLLIGGAFALNVVFSLIIGSLIGNITNHSVAHLIKNSLLLCLSFPLYWWAIVVIFIFGVQLKLFPFIGSSSARHFILPILVIFLAEGLYLTKMVSDLVATVSTSQRQRLAKFRGIHWYYRWFYQLKEVAVPLITLYGSSLTHLFGISVMVEIIFSISGLGKLLMEAILARDYPIIQGIVLLIACGIFLLNYFVDLLIEKLDSRIQVQGGGAAK